MRKESLHTFGIPPSLNIKSPHTVKKNTMLFAKTSHTSPEATHSSKDLGITIDSGLKFHAHINDVIGKAGAMINNLMRSTVCRSVELMLTLYVSHIRPLIEYGSCVWIVGYLETNKCSVNGPEKSMD